MNNEQETIECRLKEWDESRAHTHTKATNNRLRGKTNEIDVNYPILLKMYLYRAHSCYGIHLIKKPLAFGHSFHATLITYTFFKFSLSSFNCGSVPFDHLSHCGSENAFMCVNVVARMCVLMCSLQRSLEHQRER